VRIAICDDEKKERDEVLSLLQTYSLLREKSFIYHLFDSGSYLLDSVEAGVTFDMIILDILMPGLTGIETAQQIRSVDSRVKIIFLTSSSEFAVDSYSVDAYYYLLKPVEKKNFYEILEKAFCRKSHYSEASITVGDGKRIRRIFLSELVYCEIQRHTIYYFLEDSMVIQSSGTLAELEQNLLRYVFFVKPHRSYLINLRHITEITAKEVKTDIGKSIPLSRGKYNEISHAFLTYAFEEGGV
jgi:DNA-binding LytR/AlgR family response regulator